FTFCYLGSLSASTNLKYIIQTFIKANIKNCRLLIAGSGVLKDEITKIITKSGNSNIYVIDAPKEKVVEIQSKADIMVLPLKRDVAFGAFPSKIPAYLFSHKPILASLEIKSDVGEMITNAKCGWCVEPDDENALLKLFQTIPYIPNYKIEEMGENGYKWGLNNLSREKNLNLMISVFEKTLKTKNILL
ncbi:MAG: glycosyltransferase, partial [Muribaculaceae bacterium]